MACAVLVRHEAVWPSLGTTQSDRTWPVGPAPIYGWELSALSPSYRVMDWHRRAATLSVATLLGAALILPWAGSAGGQAAGQLKVNMPAFSGQGELAFISSGRVWSLDGTSGTLRELPVPSGFVPFSPMLSHDGRWLAYIAVRSTNTSYQAELWLAQGDGTGAHLLSDVPVGGVGDVAWSPAADLLAVVTQAGQRPNAVDVVSPEGTVRHVFALPPAKLLRGYVVDAEWSPSGGAVAVSTVDFGPGGSSAVRAYPVDGGPPTTWFDIRNAETLPDICTGCGGRDVIADLAGWWSGWGIGFWVFSSGMTHNNDDTPLEVVSGPGARPRLIGATLSDGETVALASAADGSLAIVESTGGREIGSGKQVETCQPASRTCTPVPGASTWTAPRPSELRQSLFRPSSGRRPRLGGHARPGLVARRGVPGLREGADRIHRRLALSGVVRGARPHGVGLPYANLAAHRWRHWGVRAGLVPKRDGLAVREGGRSLARSGCRRLAGRGRRPSLLRGAVAERVRAQRWFARDRLLRPDPLGSAVQLVVPLTPAVVSQLAQGSRMWASTEARWEATSRTGATQKRGISSPSRSQTRSHRPLTPVNSYERPLNKEPSNHRRF